MSEYNFRVDPAVEVSHQAGVKYSSHGEFEAADELFDTAMWTIPGAYGIDLDSKTMHTGRVLRDMGMHDLRRAAQHYYILGSSPREGIRAAQTLLLESEAMIGDLSVSGRRSSDYSMEAWDYLSSEHGATVSALGRLTLVKRSVVLEEIAGIDELADDDPLRTAEDVLSDGSNRYYEASNRIFIALGSRLEGRSRVVSAYWLARASGSLVRACLEDRGNIIPAAKAVASRSFAALSSQKIAKKHILTRP